MKTTNIAQHTPGPWTAFGHPFACTIKAGDDTIAGTTNNRIGEANARLIAAAPDILEACQRVLRAINWSTSEDRLTTLEQAAILATAIAKATD